MAFWTGFWVVDWVADGVVDCCADDVADEVGVEEFPAAFSDDSATIGTGTIGFTLSLLVPLPTGTTCWVLPSSLRTTM